MIDSRVCFPQSLSPQNNSFQFKHQHSCIDVMFYGFLLNWLSVSYNPYVYCSGTFSPSFSFKLMANDTEYWRISERTVQPPLGDVLMGGLGVVNPVPVQKHRWVFASCHPRHSAYRGGIPVVLPAASTTRTESICTGDSCKLHNIQTT